MTDKKTSWMEIAVFAPDGWVGHLFRLVGGILQGAGSEWHHFFGEPGHAAFVVRLEAVHVPVIEEELRKVTATWQAGPYWTVRPYVHDEEAFGDLWPEVRGIFHANSMLALRLLEGKFIFPEALTAAKLIHCSLNQLGYSRRDEATTYEIMAARANYFAFLAEHGITDDGPLTDLGLLKRQVLHIPRSEP